MIPYSMMKCPVHSTNSAYVLTSDQSQSTEHTHIYNFKIRNYDDMILYVQVHTVQYHTYKGSTMNNFNLNFNFDNAFL
jgi:hypothetical protein